MPTAKKSPKKKLSRSVRLKKYESVYTKAVKRNSTKKTSKPRARKVPKKSPRRRTSSPKSKTKATTSKVKPKRKSEAKTKTKTKAKTKAKTNAKTTKSPKRSRRLTTYQKFVKTESKKTKYKQMAPTIRMVAIGAAWRVMKSKK